MRGSTNENKNWVNYILVGLLIVSAFANGSLYTKVKMLEKNGGGNIPNTVNNNQPSVQQPQVQAPAAGKTDIKLADKEYALGSKNAKVTIVEYTDFQCPFCKRFFDAAYSEIKKNYIDTGKVYFVVREYPLTQIHPNAQKAAEAVECAGEQNKFFEYHDKLYTTQDTWVGDTNDAAVGKFKQFAQALGLNTANFNSCLGGGKYAKKIADSITEGTKYGVQGTPAFFINGNLLSGAQPYSSFQSAIDAELK